MNESPAYLELLLPLPDEAQQELAIALLEPIGFEGFVQEADQLSAYIGAEVYDEQAFAALLPRLGLVGPHRLQQLPARNWNAWWESQYESVRIDDFCLIRPVFREVEPGFRYVITIQPEMSFGTGHHATTQMMIRLMAAERWAGTRVLDMGCGTGVLGILAEKMGAAQVDLIELDTISAENARTNLARNACERATVYTGGAEAIPAGRYDVLLANIDRNTLLALAPTLCARLSPLGSLLVSGFLAADVPLLQQTYGAEGCYIQTQLAEQDWRALQLRRREG